MSIELRASGKNPLTKEYKAYVTTIKVPSDLTKKKEIEQFKKKCEIEWQQEVDKIVNLATVVGGKDEKTILNNYKNNIARLEQLKIQFRKTIRDYSYFNNDYIGEE